MSVLAHPGSGPRCDWPQAAIASPTPAATATGWRWNAASALVRAGYALVTVGCPRIDQQAIIQTIRHQAIAITKHHGTRGAGQGRAAKPLVGLGRPLITGNRHGGVAHHRVNRVIACERAIQRDAAAQRLDRFIAGVRICRGRLEGDSRSSARSRACWLYAQT